MQIESLQLFCDLVELRNLSKTAEKHFISQSAVSQQLAQMETALKCQLVNRKKRPIELTKQGQVLHKASKDIIARYKELKSEINALKFSGMSRINVATIFSIGMHTLPDYVKQFMVRYPQVHVHIEYFSSERIYELVLTGEVDIGMVAVPKRDRHLEVFDLEDEPLVLVCSIRHPMASEKEIDINTLQFERIISFEKNIPTQKWIDSIFKRYGLTIQPVMEFDNIETVKRAVEINSGVSILPHTAVEQEVKTGTLKAINFSNETFTRPTGIIVRKYKIQSKPCKYFIKLLTEHM
jgi:DNA-binding transcriptional LysR family regulator